MDISIRRFEEKDARGVSELIRRTMRESNSRDYPGEILDPLIAYFTAEKVSALAAERHCLVAETMTGRVVGTAALEGSELLTFFVLPDQQGTGVGTKLLEALEDEARQSGIEVLHVESSLTGAAFYRRRGFAPTGRVITRTAGEQIKVEKTLDQVEQGD